MLKKVLLVFAVVIVGILIYAGGKSPAMKIERQLAIKATPEVIFPYLNDSKKMNSWMPWQEQDPTGQITYTGPAEGVGSKAVWDSKGKMGTGESEIIESIPNQLVKSRLTYIRPMEMSQLAELKMSPNSTGETVVTWSVDGHNTFVFRLFGIFMDVDKMVGGEFEKGLAKLKTMAETPVQAPVQ